MNGILVKYDLCTGCHSCEVACKKHLDLPKGEFGIKLTEVGPWEYSRNEKGPEKWEWTWIPALTKACDMCKERVVAGKMPMCVQHCQAWCMEYGLVEELVTKLDGKFRSTILVQKTQ